MEVGHFNEISDVIVLILSNITELWMKLNLHPINETRQLPAKKAHATDPLLFITTMDFFSSWSISYFFLVEVSSLFPLYLFLA